MALNWKAIQRNLSDPQKFIVRLEKKEVKTASSAVASAYTAFSGEELKENMLGSADANFRFVFGERMVSLLNLFNAGTGMDFSFLKDIFVNAQVDIKEEQIHVLYDVLLGENKVLSLDAYVDNATKKYILSAKDLNDKALAMDLEALGIGDLFFVQPLQMPAVSEKEIKTAVQEYVQIVLDHVHKVERAKEVAVVGGIREEVTSFRIIFSEDEILDIATEIREKLKADEKAASFFAALAPNKDEFDFAATLEEAIAFLEEQKEESDKEMQFVITDLVNRNNDIIGRAFSIVQDGEEEELLSFVTLSDKNSFSFAMSVEGEEVITGRGAEENGKVNADFDCKEEGELLFSISLADVDAAEKETLSGTLRFVPAEGFWAFCGLDRKSESMIKALDPSLEMKFEGSASGIKLTFSVMSETKPLISFEVSEGKAKLRDFSLPTDFVDAQDEEACADWFNSCRYDKVLENLIKAGFPPALLGGTEQGISA